MEKSLFHSQFSNQVLLDLSFSFYFEFFTKLYLPSTMDIANDPLVVNIVPPDEEQMMDFYREVLQINDEVLILDLIDQGLGSMSGFNQLTADDVTKICQNIRRPGGLLEDDNGNAQPNRGTQVTILEEKRLKQFWYYCHYCYMTQRIPDFGDVDQIPTVGWLSQLDTFVNSFPEPRDVVKPGVFPGNSQAKRWYESFEDWASKSIGPSGVPLSYVLRENTVATNPDEHAIFMPNMDEDLFRMSRHTNSTFSLGDNTMVWNMLRECFHPTKDYTWVKPFEKSKDGHGAYWAAKKHALGPGAVRTISAGADKIISTTRYDGKNKSWTFDK
ncbi:MAG: hypothetical protein ACRCZI_02445, partial [Cetobacterium sp.]